MFDLSVIVCAHNPRSDHMKRTLESLMGQTLSKYRWELLLIDNASNEPIAARWDLTWHPHGRHVCEPELGVTAARLRGIKESRSALVLFVDSDNVLAADYLELALAIQRRNPHLSVFGSGNLQPEFEVLPTPEIVRRSPLLASRSVPTAVWSNNPGDFSCIPWGTGLCVRREIADYYVELVRSLNINEILDRRGQRLFSGGDDLFSWAATYMGRGFGLFPELRVLHLISANRVTRKYVLRSTHDHCFSQTVLAYLLSGRLARRMDLFRFAHLVLHGVRNGGFAMLYTWAAARGEDQAERFIARAALRPVETNKISTAKPAGSGLENTNELFQAATV